MTVRHDLTAAVSTGFHARPADPKRLVLDLETKWDETLHPREPAGTSEGGRFGSAGGGAVVGDVHQLPLWSRVDKEAAADPYAAAIRYDPTPGWGVTSDPILGEIAHERGFDGPPKVVDAAEMDRLVAAGWQEGFRGMASPPGSDYAEQLRSGAYFPGLGQYGNGIYVTDSRAAATGYANQESVDEMSVRDNMTPEVVRVALSPDAKVGNYATLRAEMQKEQAAHNLVHDSVAVDPPRNFLGSSVGFDAHSMAFYTDVGRYAAARGYDAYVAHPYEGQMHDSTDRLVVLNRTALAVQR